MDVRLHACAYSLHTKSYKNNLNSPPFYLFRLQVLGRCRAWVDGAMREIEPGDLLLYRPGDMYKLHVEEYKGVTESGDYYLLCEGKWVDEWWNRMPRKAYQHVHLDDGIVSLWQQLSIEQHRLEGSRTELIQHLLCALCLIFDRASDQSCSKPGSPLRTNWVVGSMKRYIEENALETFRIEDVAKMAGLSVSRAVHLFKEVLGYTMIQYAQEIRLSNALERIRYTDWSLEHISQSCGFGTYSYFHKLFKQKYGVSPKLVRQQPVNAEFWDNLKARGNYEHPVSGVTSDARKYFNSTN
ncbi:AraC family transcriptional regulator [Paenibacillus sp. J22TS3]|uniref:helix-turn-helix domain-containing protein n=1 Tax=Paenibacillus sp. J22TS3 TaxID=2807192 RepID=UPI001B0AABFD|nr:AraC family transcriptional regulator [Paenibacillus sp. J22TS3]GIP23834.1 DNA-binding transcriptional regulator AraC [Paenibacillus sp. J22TS3]